MAKFRKKPVVIEAIQVSESNTDEVGDFFGHTKDDRKFGWHTLPSPHWAIVTLEGTMSARVGDWIIKEPFATDDRKFYPCKPDIFEATYEAAESKNRCFAMFTEGGFEYPCYHDAEWHDGDEVFHPFTRAVQANRV